MIFRAEKLVKKLKDIVRPLGTALPTKKEIYLIILIVLGIITFTITVAMVHGEHFHLKATIEVDEGDTDGN